MTKAVLERALETEMTHHLGYEKGDPAGAGTGNSRNGRATKTVSTMHGPVEFTEPFRVTVDYTVGQGNPPDTPQLAPAIDRITRRIGTSPRAAAADRGYG